jgi:hypothetical protein
MLTYYIYTKGEHPFGKGIVQQMTNLHEARGPGKGLVNISKVRRVENREES